MKILHIGKVWDTKGIGIIKSRGPHALILFYAWGRGIVAML
jgi:hypothetical protein